MEKNSVNVYDFDKTIYDGDSTVDFYIYILVRHPIIILRWPQIIYCAFLYALNIIDKTAFKEKIFRFLRYIPDIDAALDDFWGFYMGKIKDWYIKQKKETDIISSASPLFMIKNACDKLGVRSIGSPVDPKTGLYFGRNNKSEEKVTSLKIEYPEVKIAEFYSDSLSDSPLAELAEKAFIVKGNKISDWPDTK